MLLQAAARLRVASTRHFSTAVSSSARAAAVDASHRRIYSLFNNHGNSDYIGEPMSITEHSVQTALAAKKAGFSDVIYLDAVENKYIEEVSSCNFFCVKGKTIATPALGGSILPGITRKSIIDIARAKGFTVEERNVSVEEVLEADECFCCGTAVVVVPVGSITVKGEKTQFQGGKTGPVAQEMYDELTGIQSGKVEGPDGWLEVVPEEYHL